MKDSLNGLKQKTDEKPEEARKDFLEILNTLDMFGSVMKKVDVDTEKMISEVEELQLPEENGVFKNKIDELKNKVSF